MSANATGTRYVKKITAWIACFLICVAVGAVLRSVIIKASQNYNPCNKQDNRKVDYDGSRWVQPPEWNCPTINPRNYDGGLMIYFDKIGLEPGYANGKVQRVYVSVWGVRTAVSTMKFHVFYDTRLKVKTNNGQMMKPGRAVEAFTTSSEMVTEGELIFSATSQNDVQLDNASLFTIDFIIPEDAKAGDYYPIGMSYVDGDCFINKAKDDAGKLQMTYAFTKGIYNGYLKIMGGEPPVETTAPVRTTVQEQPTTQIQTEAPTTQPQTTAPIVPEITTAGAEETSTAAETSSTAEVTTTAAAKESTSTVVKPSETGKGKTDPSSSGSIKAGDDGTDVDDSTVTIGADEKPANDSKAVIWIFIVAGLVCAGVIGLVVWKRKKEK
ncbi:MAG: hypothetical protein K6F17_07875 [Lachnospiraceae bacterium]|nr:hypothetical protein [Lachnospiraceae bacterium]